MARVVLPADLNAVLDSAWEAAREVPGFLTESEARFLGIAAACAPATGATVEIGSFKGKSTVMLGKVVRHYGAGPVVAIDPHNFNNAELQQHRGAPDSSTWQDFLLHVEAAGVRDFVDARRAFSSEIAKSWNAPIRFLWIDGDHSYAGARSDFEAFMPHLVPGGIVAFHDALHEFAGPIRVFVEEVLRSDSFGAAGFVGSIAWAQFRPADGARYRETRRALEQRAARILPYVKDETKPRGLRKLLFKLHRARVPRALTPPAEWAELLNRFES